MCYCRTCLRLTASYILVHKDKESARAVLVNANNEVAVKITKVS